MFRSTCRLFQIAYEGFFILMYCDLLTKSWFSNYQRALELATIRYSKYTNYNSPHLMSLKHKLRNNCLILYQKVLGIFIVIIIMNNDFFEYLKKLSFNFSNSICKTNCKNFSKKTKISTQSRELHALITKETRARARILFKKCRLCILTACGQLNDESMTLHDMIICLFML